RVAAVVSTRVRTLQAGHGLNAATGEYVDMLAAGIIDPAKVTRSALQNAASIAALFLTTEAVVADKPEKTPAPAARGGVTMDFWSEWRSPGGRPRKRPPPRVLAEASRQSAQRSRIQPQPA